MLYWSGRRCRRSCADQTLQAYPAHTHTRINGQRWHLSPDIIINVVFSRNKRHSREIFSIISDKCHHFFNYCHLFSFSVKCRLLFWWMSSFLVVNVVFLFLFCVPGVACCWWSLCTRPGSWRPVQDTLQNQSIMQIKHSINHANQLINQSYKLIN